MDILEANAESVRLQITTPMSITYEGGWDTVGLQMVDTLTLPDPLRRLVNWMMRRGRVSLIEVMTHTGQDESNTRALVDTLVEQGIVRTVDVEGIPHYQILLTPKQGRQLSQKIWQALDEKGQKSSPPTHVLRQPDTPVIMQRLREVILSEKGRFWIAVSPVVVVSLLSEWLLLTRTASFAQLLSFAGVISNSLTAGIFPVLLLISSRRKSDFVPEVVYRFLDHPLVVLGIYMLFLANLFLHGLIIWQNTLARASAVGFGLLVLGVTLVMLRRGTFGRRIVVEWRNDQRGEGQTLFAITTAGQPTAAEVELGYPESEYRCSAASGEVTNFSTLRYVVFHLPETQARDLKVWVHQVTPEGTSEALSGLLEVHCGQETKQFDLKLSGGQVILPLTHETCWFKLTF